MKHDAPSIGRLQLDGSLTIRTAEAVCEKLRNAIADHSTVVVDVSSATEIDLSFLQLLIAARGGGNQPTKSITLGASPDGALQEVLTRGGFSAVTDHHPELEGAVYWFDGAQP